MKILRVYLIAILLLVFAYLGSVLLLNKKEESPIDFTYVNGVTRQVEDDYRAGTRYFETGNDYRILLCVESGYAAKLNDAFSDNCVVTDITMDGQLVGKVLFDSSVRRYEQMKKNILVIASVIYAIVFIILLGMGLYQYVNVMRPFVKLKSFATAIASGNLDLPLAMNHENYFGDFTESFDLMRDELNRAKKSEYEANKSKKELVASLSHDIKTPISTIKAVCEVMEVKLSDHENIDKIHTIADKADVIDHLISDLFHSTLKDLQELEINNQETESTILTHILKDSNHSGQITVSSEIPECLIWCDPLRTTQVIDNIVSNAEKYGGGAVQVFLRIADGFLVMCIRDSGQGVPEEDMAMICEKFYRGSNTEGKTGSGLGLYLVKTFMEGMKGFADFYNDEGFVAELRFRLVVS